MARQNPSTVLLVGVPVTPILALAIARWADAAGLEPEELAGHLVTLGARVVQDVADRAARCPVVFVDASALEVTAP